MKKYLVLPFFIFFALSAWAQDNTVIVTGFGNSMDEAKYSAFITAVEQVLGVMVSSDVMIENGELIKDKIRSNSEGFIESYTIISSGKDEETWVVTIKATVAQKKLQTQIDELTHVNDAQKAYEAVKCRQGYKNAIMCTSGDLSLFDMNFGIHADSYAALRHYMGDIVQTQLYFRLTLREKGYFYKVTDPDGKELKLIYVDMGSQSQPFNAPTISEDFIVTLGEGDLDYLKKFVNTGLELKIIGSKKETTIKLPPAYIEGFVDYIQKNF